MKPMFRSRIMRAVWTAAIMWTVCVLTCMPIEAQPLGFQSVPSNPGGAHRFVANGTGVELRLAANAAVIDVDNGTPIPARLRLSILGADAHAPDVTLQQLPDAV